MALLGARGADLVVWWEKGLRRPGGRGGQRVIAAFEQDSSKQVELVLPLHDDAG